MTVGVHKGVESAINYIKIFQYYKAWAISVGIRYTEDHMMHSFTDIFQQGGKYSVQIKKPLIIFEKRRKIIDKKSLSIPDLQNDYLDLDNSVIYDER